MEKRELGPGARPDPDSHPDRAAKLPDPGGDSADGVSEEYRKYKEAEREEEQRLERYERTKSTDTVHPVRDRR